MNLICGICFTDGVRLLVDAELSSFLPAAHMLIAVAEGSPIACERVVTELSKK